MKKICSNNNYGISILLTAFLFIRTALLSPLYCLSMNDEYPYFSFSVEGLTFIVLLLAFSALSVVTFWKISDRVSQIAGLIFLFAMSDPLFFSVQDNSLKLAINILILLLVLNAISEERKLASDVLLPVILFVSALLVPYSVFAYAPAIFSIYILVSRADAGSNRYIKVVVIGIICAAAGFLLNNVLCDNVDVFNNFITKFTFADEGGINKHWKLIYAFLPTVVFAGVFFNSYMNAMKTTKLKKGKKSEILGVTLDAFFVPFVISLITVFFIAAEGAYASNILISAIIIALLFKKDEHCIAAIENITEFMKNHRFITAIIIVAVYAVALSGTINYHSAKQLIFYIRY